MAIRLDRPVSSFGARVSTGAVAGLGQVDVAVTWPTALPDTNYTVVASVEVDESGDSLTIRRIRSKTTAGCVVNVANGAAIAKTGTVHAVAVRG